MNPRGYVGMVLIAAGLVLFIIGMNASNSLADQISNTFTGRFTQGTTWYLITGGALGIVGLIMLIMNMGGKRA